MRNLNRRPTREELEAVRAKMSRRWTARQMDDALGTRLDEDWSVKRERLISYLRNAPRAR